MVGIVIVSHSYQLAEEIIRFASEMKRFDFPLINAAGLNENDYGSNPLNIKEKIKEAFIDEGVLVFVDIGSSILNTQMAIEFLDDEYDTKKILIADAPLVEGVIVAISTNEKENNALEKIQNELKQLKLFKKG